jgi:hypothetical protein
LRLKEANMIRTTHGKMIRLDEDLAFAEGQVVETTARTLPPAAGFQPGEGLLRTEGALANVDEWDDIMKAVYQDRKHDTHRELPE